MSDASVTDRMNELCASLIRAGFGSARLMAEELTLPRSKRFLVNRLSLGRRVQAFTAAAVIEM